jgi:fluoride ion exporter CrcB/FEX
MLNYILAAVGGATGRIPRFWISGVIANRPGQSSPEI